ncbi:unnamed protein product [Ceutorhynchus assimilis]|uniref:ARID domain-containing protein n=1 Tax=Ceutorhynchus assimilis TaxID=467358 RepID=A0A9P0GQL7_9CUCU|nr:unnamed protein product [Ceutorhynchus assimilis]
MQADDPPYLSVGTAVSAKYKGAFCEAKVSKVDRVVKCKVTFKSGLGATTVSDNEIKGTLRVGQQVQVKHPDHKELLEATITKIQDCSQYTVVFDDGDITTLRRTALCLKSGRHFNESETLDQLPLTHPEHFGIPVMGGRRGRRNRLLKDESSDEELEEETEPDLEGYTQDIGRVVSVETGENKRGKEKWFPGLIVIPSAQPTVKINIKDEFLIRSFRDDRYYTVPKKEVNEFNRDLTEKIDSAGLAEAIQKANKFLDNNELPLHWEKSSLFHNTADSDSEDNVSETSDEEQSEEKDRFVAQLYKYMDDSGTPLNKTPTIAGKDIDLHRLFLIVDKMGGYNRATNQGKWKAVAGKMRLTVNQNVSNQVKSVYKKCLLSYEGFFRTLGVTMSNPVRSVKKAKGRSLIRDKDRTPVSSPRPERDDDLAEKPATPLPEKQEPKLKRKSEVKEKEPIVKKIKVEPRDTSGDVSDTPSTSSIRPKRHENKMMKDKKIKPAQGEKVKMLVEKFEESAKKEEKVQLTRSKTLTSLKPKELVKEMVTTRQSKEGGAASPTKPVVTKPVRKVPVKEEEVTQEKDKKPKITKKKAESEKLADIDPLPTANLGDKLIVYYGPTNESKVTYEAKVVDMDKDPTGPLYFVHYTGWNTRYDEWIPAIRIAENLSSGTKSKRGAKVPTPVNVRPSSSSTGPSCSTSKPSAGKRSRLTSSSSRGAPEEKTPRSTSPSSGTSTGSMSRSPAMHATRSIRLAAKQESKRRRISAQTDVSAHSDSEHESSESEAELPRTRSGSIKTDETEVKTYKKKARAVLTLAKVRKDAAKDDQDAEAEKGDDKRIIKKIKKASEKSADESDEEDSFGAKGRDFDLNQIRSELKGFSKAVKVPTAGIDKENVSSSEDSSEKVNIKEEKEVVTVKIEEEPKQKTPPRPASPPKLEKSSSSDDIYEFKEPEPFEFETRSKLGDDKNSKKRLPRIFDSLEDKSPRKRVGARSPLSPGKSDKLCRPEPRTYSRLPKKIQLSDDEDDDDDLMADLLPIGFKSSVDPFDKLLIESQQIFNIKSSSEDIIESKPSTSFADSLSLFKEPPETSDDCSRDMELSDCESQQQIFTREDTLFSTTFSKSPTDRNTPDFSSSKTDEGKTTNSDDDDIQAQIQRVIAQSSSTDDDSSNSMIIAPITNPISSPKKAELEIPPNKIISKISVLTLPSTSKNEPSLPPALDKEILEPINKPAAEQEKKPEPQKSETPSLPTTPTQKPSEPISTPEAIEIKPPSPKKPIDPALQETDSTLLESIVATPPLILNPKLDETCKELTAVKTGTKVADSILQKFSFIKNNIETKSNKSEASSSLSTVTANTSKEKRSDINKPSTRSGTPLVTKPENTEPKPSTSEIKPFKPILFDIKPSEIKSKLDDNKPSPKPLDILKPKSLELLKGKPPDVLSKPSTSTAEFTDTRRRRRPISKAIIEESDSDSSDSEHLIIRSDNDDSQTNSSDNKPLIESKNTDSNMSSQKIINTTTDDSESQPEVEKRNFSFEDILPKDKPKPEVEEKPKDKEEPPEVPAKLEEKKTEIEPTEKEEVKQEQDPNLHSLLLCEEEIPRSPAPVIELPSTNEGANTSSVHEMPFASAPGTSNSKMLLEPPKKHQPPPLVIPIERENRVVDAQAVIENTPPTTPESTISNLSPRGDNGNISPISNDSKSNEGEPDFGKSGAIKDSPYSEEDTQPSSDLPRSRKTSESFGPPLVYRKRRRSLRNSEDGSSSVPVVPAKRGRKPRQRRDTDSDDASENSMAGSGFGGGGTTPGSTTAVYERSTRSPRPSKYNFFVEFDPSLDSTQRIAVLQQKLAELRKTYADVKAELATVERRRKKIRRREREVPPAKDNNLEDQTIIARKREEELAEIAGVLLQASTSRLIC